MAGKDLVCPGPSHPHSASSGGTSRVAVSATAQNSFQEAAVCEPKVSSGNQPQPQCIFAQESNACLVLTWPYAPHRAKESLGFLWLRGHCCMTRGLRGLKPTPNVFSFGEKADVAGKRLVWPGLSNPHLASSGVTPLVAVSATAQNSLLEAAFPEHKRGSGNHPHPQFVFAQESNACLVLT